MNSGRPEIDPIEDLLIRMQEALSRARGKVANKGELAAALGVSLLSLSHIRNPANTSRRQPKHIEGLQERVEALLKSWCKKKFGTKLKAPRLELGELESVLGPFVRRTKSGLSLVESSLHPERESRWVGDPTGINRVEPFLSQNICVTESIWQSHVNALQQAFDWTKGLHADPYVDRVFRTIVRAAHCINAMTPIADLGHSFSPSAHRLMELTRKVVRRVMATTKDPFILSEGYRVLGYSNHAWQMLGEAVREFNFGLRALNRVAPTSTNDLRQLELARLDALLAGIGPRGLKRLDLDLRNLELSHNTKDPETTAKLLRARAKLSILTLDYRTADKMAVQADDIDSRGALTNHGGFERWIMRAAIEVGLGNKREAKNATDKALNHAELGGLESQEAKVGRFCRHLKSIEKSSIIAVQGYLLYRYKG